ncbi:MAG: MarR family transcriptional regulator [Nitrospinae bacterium]|nr:MarR family transcriptional regulator [Nitrospinota bacterium]
MDITPQACCEGTALETHDLGARLHVALNLLFHQKKPADREAVCRHDITHNQWTLLHMLADADAGPISMGVIARRMRLTPSGVTRCADPLVERGLIERCMKEGDRRVCCLSLSEAGEALHTTISEGCALEDGALLERFSPEEQIEIVSAIEKLARAAKEFSS